jgi:hypothetical protein
VPGYKIGVLTESIAGAFDLDDNGVVEQPIKECDGDNGITEHVAQGRGQLTINKST